jgi:hypothetical protein
VSRRVNSNDGTVVAKAAILILSFLDRVGGSYRNCAGGTNIALRTPTARTARTYEILSAANCYGAFLHGRISHAAYHLISPNDARQEIFFSDTEPFLRMRSSVVRRYHWIC